MSESNLDGTGIENTWSSARRVYQGRIFSYELGNDCLTFKLFRLLPLARIRLRDIRQIRSGHWSDILPHRRRPIIRQIRCSYWPSLMGGHVMATRYVLERANRGRTLIRMEPGFCYRLRMAVGAHQRAARGEKD